MKNSETLFPDFIGNTDALQQLSADIEANRLPHALLLEGAAGCGKRTLAKMIARAVVCEAAQPPCGVCTACRKAANGTHPDITEIVGDGRERTLHIDAIRNLRHTAYVLPNEAPRRVCILCDAHTMTPQAQNALLKILEEPPAFVLFILTCENRAQLLPTIVSRTATVSLGSVTWEEAAPLLRKRLPAVDEHTIAAAFAISNGVIGQVLSGFEDDTLKKVLDLTPQIARALIAPHGWELAALTARLEKDKETLTGVLSGLSLILRDALTLHYGGTATLSGAPDVAASLSAHYRGIRLIALMREVEYLQNAAAHNMNHTLLLTQLHARLYGKA